MRFGPDQIIECPHCGFLAKKQNCLSGNGFGATLWSDGKVDAPMLPDLPIVTKCRNCQNFYWVDTAKIIREIDFNDRSEIWKEVEFVRNLTLDEFAEAIDMGVGDNVQRQRYLLLQFWWSLNDKIRYDRSAFSFANEIRKRQTVSASSDESVPRNQELISSQDETKSQDDPDDLSYLFDENHPNYQPLSCEDKANLESILNPSIEDKINAQKFILSQYEEKLQDYLPKLSALLDENELNDQIMKAEIARATGNFAEAIRLLETIPDKYRWITNTLIPLAQQGNRWVTELSRD
jgi:predicted DNA-binding protein YlxM (UPF0122 family)